MWRRAPDGNFLKNEATDLYENKGPGLGRIRNEATVDRQFSGTYGDDGWWFPPFVAVLSAGIFRLEFRARRHLGQMVDLARAGQAFGIVSLQEVDEFLPDVTTEVPCRSRVTSVHER